MQNSLKNSTVLSLYCMLLAIKIGYDFPIKSGGTVLPKGLFPLNSKEKEKWENTSLATQEN